MKRESVSSSIISEQKCEIFPIRNHLPVIILRPIGLAGVFSLGNSKCPPEIWQREKFGQLIIRKIIEIVATI